MPSEMKQCPYCGKVPKIDFTEDMSWSRTRKTFGRKTIAYTCHHCVQGKELWASGSAIVWADFNRDRPYGSEDDWYAAQDKAEAICVRKWNRAVAQITGKIKQ